MSAVVAQTVERLIVRCAVCRRSAVARRITARFTIEPGNALHAIWTKLPPGWWRLEQQGLGFHCRCSRCLASEKAAK